MSILEKVWKSNYVSIHRGSCCVVYFYFTPNLVKSKSCLKNGLVECSFFLQSANRGHYRVCSHFFFKGQCLTIKV